MKKLVMVAVLSAISLAYAQPKEDAVRLSDIKSGKIKATQKDLKKSKVPALRAEALKEVALQMGSSYGLAYFYNGIYERFIKGNEAELDRKYDFEKLSLSAGVMPPILSQNFSHYELVDDNHVVISDKDFKIEEPARMVSVYPTWRDYLQFDFKAPDLPTTNFLPKNSAERLIWDENVEKGWEFGKQQAFNIYKDAKGKLDRDYEGMILYKQALVNGQITPTVVASSNLGVEGDGKTLSVNKRSIQITNHSEFIVDSKKWKSKTPASYKNKDNKVF